MSIQDLTPKQRKRLQNKKMNEQQRLAKLERQSSNQQRHQSQNAGSGLSKGQRRRRNAKSRGEVLPKGLPVLPRGLPVHDTMNYAASSNGSNGKFFPSGHTSKAARTFDFFEDEYLFDIEGSDGFQCQRLPINPGQVDTFPWLSTIAKQFEKWTFSYLEFYYKPTVSGFATAGTTGKVMLSCDFDASDPTPTTKQQVEDSFPHDDCMPYEQCGLRLPQNELTGLDRKFVRPGAVPPNSDIKMYDGGAFFISTQGNSGIGAKIGELRVRYHVWLSVPVLESLQTAPPITQTSSFTGSASDIPEGTNKNLTSMVTHGNPLGISVVDNNQLVFPVGNFIVNVRWQVSAEGAGNIILDWSSGSDVSALDYTNFQAFCSETLGTATAQGVSTVTMSDTFILVATPGLAWIPYFNVQTQLNNALATLSCEVIVQSLA
jgi:hypothetical protein